MTLDKKNSFWLATQYLCSISISFIIVKLNIEYFGLNLYGLWIILLSFWGIGNAIDLGFSTAIIKYVAEAKKTNDIILIQSIISTGLIVFLILGILLVIFGNVLASLIYYTNTSIVLPEYLSTTKILIPLLSINFYLQYLSSFLRAILEGLNNFTSASKVLIINNFSIIIFVFIVINYKLSIVYLAIFYCISSFSLLFIYFFVIKKSQNDIKFSFSLFDKKLFLQLGKFSISVQFASLFGALIDPLIKYLIGAMSSLSLVSIYEIAHRFAIAISGLFSSAFRIMLPKVSILKSQQEFTYFFSNNGMKAIKMGIVYSGFTFGISAILITSVIKIWYGFDEAVLVFLILSLPESINNFGYSIYIFFIGIGKPVLTAFFQLINLFIITASLILGLLMLGDILGLLGYFFTVALVNILMLIFLKKIAHISIKKLLLDVSFYKLIVLDIIIICSVLFIYYNISSIIITTLVISLFSLFLFWNDLVYYLKQSKRLVKI